MRSSEIDPEQVLTGHQDCGTNYLKNNIWTNVLPGDGYECLLDPKSEKVMFGTRSPDTPYEPNANLFRSTSNPNAPSFSSLPFPQTNDGALQGAALIYNSFNPNSMFQGRENLWKTIKSRSFNTSSDWIKLSDFSNLFQPSINVIKGLEISSLDTNTIYTSCLESDAWNVNYDNCKLMVTNNGGGANPGDWTNITPLGDTKMINDIAVSSWDKNHVWICYNGYNRVHVKKTIDGGTTWTNFDDNLPDTPVNCIIYLNGSNDAIFVGTDVGVYYRDNTMNQWIPFMTNLPNVIVNWLEINYEKGYLRAATYGRGLWETPLPCTKNTTPTYLTGNVTLIAPQRFANNIIIEPGVSLTIKSKVYMLPSTKIIVKPGGELILNGGTITSGCNQLWSGIEVWGNSLAGQGPMSNQGKIYILNGGVIANAQIGILCSKRDCESCDIHEPGYAGGLIWCDSAYFVNNRIAVQFAPYNFFSHSYFRRTHFVTSDALLSS
ncbi:MAG: WD40/YVTN/BNR-like repeat-containing protein, partial [Bacteroidales bacterium]